MNVIFRGRCGDKNLHYFGWRGNQTNGEINCCKPKLLVAGKYKKLFSNRLRTIASVQECDARKLHAYSNARLLSC